MNGTELYWMKPHRMEHNNIKTMAWKRMEQNENTKEFNRVEYNSIKWNIEAH